MPYKAKHPPKGRAGVYRRHILAKTLFVASALLIAGGIAFCGRRKLIQAGEAQMPPSVRE